MRADLAANVTQCSLAYWHHPRWSSGSHGNSTISAGVIEALYDLSVDVVVVGHDHDCGRFAPMDPSGSLDAANGIRQFVVGTGGKSLRAFGTPEANSEVRYNDTDGVTKFTLGDGAYAWEFLATDGRPSPDTGEEGCR